MLTYQANLEQYILTIQIILKITKNIIKKSFLKTIPKTKIIYKST